MAPIDPVYYSNDGRLFHGTSQQFNDFFERKACSFDDLFNNAKRGMLAANQGHGDADHCVEMIRNAVRNVANETKVPDCLIFAIILQESSGSCRVETPRDSDQHPTPGLMQCEGSPSAQSFAKMSQDVVDQMVRAGARHYASNLQEAHGNHYLALRLYNSGSATGSDLSDARSVGTVSYVSDVANKLHGCLERHS